MVDTTGTRIAFHRAKRQNGNGLSAGLRARLHEGFMLTPAEWMGLFVAASVVILAIGEVIAAMR